MSIIDTLLSPFTSQGQAMGLQGLNGPDAVSGAAQSFGVPLNILWGVFGMETNFGKDVKTSSAGAEGDFQFLPGTAREYGYPLTNSPTAAQFNQQARSAARYLSVLHRQALGMGLRGNAAWDNALRRYSGGGYGLQDVLDKAKGAPTDKTGVPLAVQAGQSTGNTVAGWGEELAKVLATLLDPAFWLRVAEAVGGIALLLMGLKSLTGGTVDPVGAAGRVAARAV
ncbi:MAG TPA: hypothetical protein VF032_19490 [Thermoleophilaceae bacterium]